MSMVQHNKAAYFINAKHVSISGFSPMPNAPPQLYNQEYDQNKQFQKKPSSNIILNCIKNIWAM